MFGNRQIGTVGLFHLSQIYEMRIRIVSQGQQIFYQMFSVFTFAFHPQRARPALHYVSHDLVPGGISDGGETRFTPD